MTFLRPAETGSSTFEVVSKPKAPKFVGTNMLEPQYADAYELWKRNPDPHNTTVLLKTITPEIDRGLLAHVGSSNPLIRSKAKMLTIRALKSYDPSQAKLGTHIVNQLQSLKRVARQQAHVLSVPERVSLNQAIVERSRIELEDKLGRDPSMQELADATGLSIARLKHIKRFQRPLAEGTLTAATGEEGESSYVGGPAVQQSTTGAWLEYVYSDQDGMNQKIMEWTLGLHGQPILPNHEIARRLGVSQGAISQRKARIQETINQLELNPFNG